MKDKTIKWPKIMQDKTYKGHNSYGTKFMMEKTYEGQDSQESSQESCSRDSTLKMVFIFPIVFMAYFEGSMRNIQSNT